MVLLQNVFASFLLVVSNEAIYSVANYWQNRLPRKNLFVRDLAMTIFCFAESFKVGELRMVIIENNLLKHRVDDTISDLYYCSLFPKLPLGKAVSMKFPLHILKKRMGKENELACQ